MENSIDSIIRLWILQRPYSQSVMLPYIGILSVEVVRPCGVVQGKGRSQRLLAPFYALKIAPEADPETGYPQPYSYSLLELLMSWCNLNQWQATQLWNDWYNEQQNRGDGIISIDGVMTLQTYTEPGYTPEIVEVYSTLEKALNPLSESLPIELLSGIQEPDSTKAPQYRSQKRAKSINSSSSWLWLTLAIALGVAAVGFLVYMFMQQGFKI